MSSRISDPYEPIQPIEVTIGDISRTVSLHAFDSTLVQAIFERRDGQVNFRVLEGNARLAQFGNKTTSKQRQASYLVRLPSSGSLRIETARQGGDYGAGCELCLQVYDARHAFLTQIRTPLSASTRTHEAKLPRNAAHGCFSVQLSGSGVLDAISIRLSAANATDGSRLALEEGLFGADDLHSLLEAARKNPDAMNELRAALLAQPLFAIASFSKWYSDGDYYSLIELMQVSAQWRDIGDMPKVVAQLKFQCARGLSKLNATASALETICQIQAIPEWRSLLAPREIQHILLLKGQSLVRNGRPDDGVAALNVARLNDPANWEAYFYISNNLSDQDAPLKDAHLESAMTLRDDPHPKVLVAAIENDLQNKRWPEARSRALDALTKLKTPNDVSLSLANIHLQIDDMTNWRRFISGYFEQYELSAPNFDQPSVSRGIEFSSAPAPVADDSPDRGLVAVIMTTFNSDRTVEQAARSVLAQTYSRIVLVIVDDASSDQTLSIARSLAESDQRVQVIQNPSNAGTYVCKNIALASVEADYYTFHDSDDWMHPERVARHLDVMRDRGIACTTSQWFRMDSHGYAVARHAGGYQHANPASIFIRKDVLEAVGFFDSVRTGADTEFLWRIRNMYARDQIVEIKLPLAIGLFHEASLTQSGVTAFNQHRYSEVRLAYWESWVRWHLEALTTDRSRLRLPRSMDSRPFWAPPAIMPDGGQSADDAQGPLVRSLFSSSAGPARSPMEDR